MIYQTLTFTMLSLSSHTTCKPLMRGDDKIQVTTRLSGQPRGGQRTNILDEVVRPNSSLAMSSSTKHESSPLSARKISSSKPSDQIETPVISSSDESVPLRKPRTTKKPVLYKTSSVESTSPKSSRKGKTVAMNGSNSSSSSSGRRGRIKKTSRMDDSSRRRRNNKRGEMDDSSRRHRCTELTPKRSPVKKTHSSPRARTAEPKSRVIRVRSEGISARPRRTESLGAANRANRPRRKRSDQQRNSRSPPPFELVRTFSEPQFEADSSPSEKEVSGVESSSARLRTRAVRVKSKKRSPRRTKTNREGLSTGSHKQRRNQKELAKNQVQQALMNVVLPEVFADEEPAEQGTELHPQDELRQKKIQELKEHHKGKETQEQQLQEKEEVWSLFQGGSAKVKALALEKAQSTVESARLAADMALTTVSAIRPKSTHQRTSNSGETPLGGSNRSFKSASEHTRTTKVQSELFGRILLPFTLDLSEEE